MRADRGVNAAVGAFRLFNDVVQRFAHTVQALELVAVLIAARHFYNGGAGVGVVGRELRIDAVAPVEQHLRAGHVADIGVDLASEDREGLDPHFLGELDLSIPVGALNQPHHNLAVKPLGQLVECLDHRRGAAPVGLHDHPEAVPSIKTGVGH